MDEVAIMERLKEEGYDNVWAYNAEPNEVDEEHSHDYDTKLHILNGYIWIQLVDSGRIVDYKFETGQEAEIPRDKKHSAKVGPDRCRYIVAEKH